ncbi:MAG: hypothetical protein ACLQU2_27725 [Candidatus Binataceae bacterium]
MAARRVVLSRAKRFAYPLRAGGPFSRSRRRLCFRATGGTAVFESAPFERVLRDVNAARHITLRRTMMEGAGHVALACRRTARCSEMPGLNSDNTQVTRNPQCFTSRIGERSRVRSRPSSVGPRASKNCLKSGRFAGQPS